MLVVTMVTADVVQYNRRHVLSHNFNRNTKEQPVQPHFNLGAPVYIVSLFKF